MKALTLVLGLIALVPAKQAQFVAVDIYANSDGKGLAAWQIELDCDPSKAKIVGVEGGEKPPYYDPAALQGGRIILASFTTEPQPPAGRVLVARVHLQETGKTDYAVKVMAAAAPGGERIEPTIDLVRTGGK
ncbi:MAG TPA: hypothetical protein VNM14_00155 [Planctomycetota bacterium]|jgi:hypothetical protein|nr:hypothetical protein [Planctomycetota bacterium]